MSLISGLGGGNTGAMSLVDFLGQRDEEKTSILDTSTTLASSSRMLENAGGSRRGKAAYGAGASSSIGQMALKKALSDMGAEGKVTFKDIAAYRENLEEEFSQVVRLDLANRGVSLETSFTLTMTNQGQIQVECDDALAKERIEAYLQENPKVCEQFGYIQALSNLDRAAQSPLGGQAAWEGIRNSRVQIQTQAVEIFFGEALNAGMNYSSLLASFGSQAGLGAEESSASFYAGLDFTV